MELSRALAVKLLRLANGERLPASELRYTHVPELIAEGILIDHRIGRTKSMLFCPDPKALGSFLRNNFQIIDLQTYVELLNQNEVSRADLTRNALNSKARAVRTFKGFLINSFKPIPATLGGAAISISPPAGTFQFIHKYEQFVPDKDVVVVNVENSENFSQIARQQHLFNGLSTLFVSRYPQNRNKDLLRWLQGIPNLYLHFGDFDFAGINIYLNEYKRSLGKRAKFFIPDNIEELIVRYGNRALYDYQKPNFQLSELDEPGLQELSLLLHRYKRGLEQEALIPRR